MISSRLRSLLEKLCTAALQSVDPYAAVRDFLEKWPANPNCFRKIYLAGIGKAAVPMAKAVEDHFGSLLDSGLVIVKDGHGGTLEKSRVREASHPEPDERGRRAALETLDFLTGNVGPQDLLVFVISGGGSALFPLPVEQITLRDKQSVTSTLIRCGADIREINTIRKHLSRVKGGRLLEYTQGAQVLSLILSDVVGDDIPSIASGPTSPDPSSFRDCLEIVERYGIKADLPSAVIEYLESGSRGGSSGAAETPKPGDPRFERVENVVVAGNFVALQAAARVAGNEGFAPLILSSSITGDTRDVARVHVAIAGEIVRTGHPLPPPCCLISGGETTVEVRGDGKGGRNQEFALHCALELSGWPDRPVLIASIGSDGTDGPTDAAGAAASTDTVFHGRERGLEAGEFLKRNDSYHFFQGIGDLIFTGPTRTNVMDLRFVLIDRN